jgi:hypothetical protein
MGRGSGLGAGKARQGKAQVKKAVIRCKNQSDEAAENRANHQEPRQSDVKERMKVPSASILC